MAYRFDGDVIEVFNQDIISCSRNSILLNWDLNKTWVCYKPEDIKLNDAKIKFFRIKNEHWAYIFSPLILSINMIKVFKILLYICWKFRPKVLIVENYTEGMIGGIIRRCALVNKSIYIPADWFAGQNYKKLLSNVANNLFFPWVDYLACRFNDIVIDPKGSITSARNKYWRRKITTTKDQFFLPLQVKVVDVSGEKQRTNICFFGELREDSGLDIAIRSLNEIRKQLDISLKIIGRKRLWYVYLAELVEHCHLAQFVKFMGFVEKKDFNHVFCDSFCGINVLTSERSYSSYVINSKILYYFQYLLPVIVTNGLNESLLSDIRKYNLGIIIKPDPEEFVSAVAKIYARQNWYRENIIAYIQSLPKNSMRKYVNTTI